MIFEFSLCAVFLACILITDVRSYRIKNVIVLPMLLAGLIIGLVRGHILSNVFGMLLPLLLFPLFALRMLGAGDIKALCALGAVLGINLCAWLLPLTFLSGGVIALAFIIAQRNAKERISYFLDYLRTAFLQRRPGSYFFGGSQNGYFRFAYAIAGGVILTALHYYGLLF